MTLAKCEFWLYREKATKFFLLHWWSTMHNMRGRDGTGR